LRKTNLVSKSLSILKSMAIAVSLRPLFARKFGNIELMNILPAGCKTPRARTRIQHSTSTGGEFKHANIIATLFLGRPKSNLTLDHQFRRERRERLPASVLAIAAAKNVGPIRRHRAPLIPGFADMPFFQTPVKPVLHSRMCII
jgi:hypothetical protein